MSQFFSDIKESCKRGNFLTRLIYINAGAFFIIKCTLVLFMLFKVSTHWISYLQVPAFIPSLLHQPWSILTYMFLHTQFIHAIFNLIALYYFGRLFLTYYNQKQLVAVYIWGGLAGAALYVIGYNIIPYFVNYQTQSYLLGASASVMAILFATVGYAPNSQVQLALVGNVKLKHIGWVFLALDLIGLGSVNSGGSMAHLGGAFMGLLFGYCYANGKDLSKPITKALDWLANHYHVPSFKGWRTSKKKIKVTVNNTQNMSDAQWNQQQKEREKLRQERIDQILEKIKKSGYQNLTDEEKKSLFQLSKKDQ
jgi:membrane associated rhomboid family serine protease